MKNNIMFIWSGVINNTSDIYRSILSIKDNIKNCDIFVMTPDLDEDSIQLLIKLNVKVIKFPISIFSNRRMTCKIEQIYELLINHIPEDGNLFVCDGDTIFCKDPFKVFNKGFDVLYTTRGYDCWVSTNGGVIGFNNNQKAKNFLNYFIEQIKNPTWSPYVNFRLNHPHNKDLKNLDWWVDQDFMHCINLNKESVNNKSLGFDITVFDAGPKYNKITQGTTSFIKNVINSKDNYIVHLKGGGIKRW